VAADYLAAHGFTILGTNVRLGYLELDIVARKGPLAIILEVRTRGPGSFLSAFASVTGPKRRRLRVAALRLWRRMKHDPTLDRIRVDVAAVDLRTTPVTIEIAEAVV
jgi:putative endonuclease